MIRLQLRGFGNVEHLFITIIPTPSQIRSGRTVPSRTKDYSAQSAEATEYADFISAEGKTLPRQRMSWYDIKQPDGKAPEMLELWGMLSNHSLPLLQGSLWLGVVTPDRVLSMGQIELFDI